VTSANSVRYHKLSSLKKQSDSKKELAALNKAPESKPELKEVLISILPQSVA